MQTTYKYSVNTDMGTIWKVNSSYLVTKDNNGAGGIENSKGILLSVLCQSKTLYLIKGLSWCYYDIRILGLRYIEVHWD